MKTKFWIPLFIFLLLAISCAKIDESPEMRDMEASRKSLPTLDAAWIQEYENLIFSENYFLELIASGSIDENEVNEVHSALLNGHFDVDQMQDYLAAEEYQALMAYVEAVNAHFEGVQFTSADLKYLEEVNLNNIAQWTAYFPEGNVVMSKRRDCEEEAAKAALGVLGSCIAGGAACAVFTGGLSIVGGVFSGVAGSVTTWLIYSSGC